METSSKVTVEYVRGWLADIVPKRGPRWPVLPDEAIAAVANACNRESLDHSVRKDISSEMSNLWGATRALRTSTGTLLSELPRLIEIYDRIVASSQQCDELEFLITLQPMLQRLRDILDPSRKPGGQNRPYVTFTCRLAVHIRSSLEQQGGHASLKPGRPLVRFISSALTAVYGKAPDDDAIAKELVRYFRGLREQGFG
jgi:hypothetical protein